MKFKKIKSNEISNEIGENSKVKLRGLEQNIKQKQGNVLFLKPDWLKLNSFQISGVFWWIFCSSRDKFE